jgi:hypothetical protein
LAQQGLQGTLGTLAAMGTPQGGAQQQQAPQPRASQLQARDMFTAPRAEPYTMSPMDMYRTGAAVPQPTPAPQVNPQTVRAIPQVGRTGLYPTPRDLEQYYAARLARRRYA